MTSKPKRAALPRPPAWLPRAVLIVVAILAAVFVVGAVLYQLRSLVFSLFLSLFVAVALEPSVQALVKRGWRRRRATAVVFVVSLLLFAGFVGALIPVLVRQASALVDNIPQYLEGLSDLASRYLKIDIFDPQVTKEFQDLSSLIQKYGSAVAGGIFSVGNTVFGAIFQLATVALFSYYLVAEGPTWRRLFLSILPPVRQKEALNTWETAVEKTGQYVYSRALLAVAAAIFTWIALALLGVPSPIPLAIWMGVMSQFIPVIGTYIGMILPALAGLGVSPVTSLWVLLALIVYQQLENYLIAPKVTKRTMAIHPAISIGAVIAGASLLGGVGAILALPITAIVQALISTSIHRHKVIKSEHVESSPDATV